MPATSPPSHPDDVAALRALYLATGGERWTRDACWLNASVPVCWWDMVVCNTTTWRVQELHLASNNLVGVVPPEIGSLTSLQLLQLTSNRGLSGPLPSEIGRLHHLRRLCAWNTSFTGPLPTALSALTSLEALDLTDNVLTGAVPPELTGLVKVNTFYLDGNPVLECPLPEGVQRWLGANVSFNAVCVPNARQVVW